MAVEEYAPLRLEVLQQRQAGAELVDEVGIGLEIAELGCEIDLED